MQRCGPSAGAAYSSLKKTSGFRAEESACTFRTSRNAERRRPLTKTSGFLKKVHALSELPKLNLSKYVDEVAAAVAEAKLKLADVPAVLQFCSLMHRSYAAFAPALLPLLLKNVALAKPGGPSAERRFGTLRPPCAQARLAPRLVRAPRHPRPPANSAVVAVRKGAHRRGPRHI